MLFNSFEFALFLPFVFVVYWLTKEKHKWLVLFIASYYFYMCWNIKYVLLIFFTTLVSYICAILIEETDQVTKKKILVASTILISGGILFLFKYFNFVSESIVGFLSLFSLYINPITLKWLLPVGISFYTFQTFSYVIDVYRGKVKAERHLGKYATFVSFFPQLVAGPIERTENLLPQIKKKSKFSYEDATYGLKLIAWGLYKKIIVADGLSLYVDIIYGDVYQYSGISLIVATILFSFQIYCDFSGYSDIAIGTAKLFGIKLMKNFNSPYLAISINDFWKRWHISLSSWFRDYIYIPLGGNKVTKCRQRFNLFCTFIVSGLWHGAAWNFIIWGGIHGVLQILENLLLLNKANRSNNICFKIFRILIVFMLVNFAWIFFRADSLEVALYVVQNMFNGISNINEYFIVGLSEMQVHINTWIRILFTILVVIVFDIISLKKDVIQYMGKLPLMVRWIVYILFLDFIIFYYMEYGIDVNSFVYFQF